MQPVLNVAVSILTTLILFSLLILRLTQNILLQSAQTIKHQCVLLLSFRCARCA